MTHSAQNGSLSMDQCGMRRHYVIITIATAVSDSGDLEDNHETRPMNCELGGLPSGEVESREISPGEEGTCYSGVW
jgi:hypothetical protein